jgi:hypothetical protein
MPLQTSRQANIHLFRPLATCSIERLQNIRKLFIVGATTKVPEDPGFHCVTMPSDNVYGHFRRRTLTIEADKERMSSLA